MTISEKEAAVTISGIFSALGIAADEAAAARIAAYHGRILALNETINLTGIRDEKESLIKNVYDSLSVYDPAYFPAGGRVLDLGTGAGFPGAILAALRPDVEFILMDSVQKKLRCVEEAAAAAGLANVKCLHMRAEEGGRRRKLRETFDAAVARAVKSLPVVAEWALPFVKEGGVFLAMKGPGADEELAEAGKILALMETALETKKTLRLPTGEERCVLVLRKRGPAPKTFPRKVGVAEKNPIV